MNKNKSSKYRLLIGVSLAIGAIISVISVQLGFNSIVTGILAVVAVAVIRLIGNRIDK